MLLVFISDCVTRGCSSPSWPHSCFSRALFSNRRPSDGELLFVQGDMFRVVDTLPAGVRGAWKAFKLDQFGKETEHGLIPTEQRWA